MPIAKSLKKVEQKIKKKNAVHPKARKFLQLNRATLREKKLSKQKMSTTSRDAQTIRLQAFRAAIDEDAYKDRQSFTDDEIKTIITRFISRDDDEIESLQAARRPGRPSSTRQDALETRRDFEIEEFSTGFYSPDLLDEANVKLLRAWNLDYSGIGKLKFVRISRQAGLQVGQKDDIEMNL
ncbi:translation machinery-associated protein 16 [Lipomyces japonicus]|uniref:translation machinery-associated protein 16 n=1 Tax=Lipomyces japonicus TaxID=56871 RepID=UPI0034CE6837